MYDYGYDYCDGFYRGLAVGVAAGILCLVGFMLGGGCSKERVITVVEPGAAVKEEAIK